MSKRKLNRQQTWRVKKIQDERSARAARRDETVDRQLNEGELGAERDGLVIAHYGSQVDIEAVDGVENGQICRCHLRTNLDALVTGDRVIWRAGNPTGVVVANQPRRSLLSRPDSSGNLRPVAANVDFIVLVIAPVPEPHRNLIDRYLVAAETVEIEPVLLLNKTDLLDENNRGDIESLLDSYRRLGYQVLEASTKTLDGLLQLKTLIHDHVSVFVGQSGVGKSSLIKTLLPEEILKIGDLSQGVAKGTHTTTTARLFHFPDGGSLIDSPGIREFGLWHINREQVADGFVEFRPFLGRCRFRDCQHTIEPGCALRKAVDENVISRERLDSFESIANSLAAL